MPAKIPPLRKGTAINNPERHAAAEGLAKSALRYAAPKIQPLADDTPKTNFRRTKPVQQQPKPAAIAERQAEAAARSAKTSPAPATIPAKTKAPASQPKPDPVRTKPEISDPSVDLSGRGNQAYAIRLLPAQVAVISDIAARLNKDERYARQIVKRKVKEALNTHRDTNSWGNLAEEASRRIDDPHGQGTDFFKSVFRITDGELAAMKCHIDDPMSVFTDFKITSAFAKAVLHQELDAVDKVTRQARGIFRDLHA